jgi:predicted dinucleotide-binding enzyme
MARFGVIGSAVVGQTLARGLRRHGHDVCIGSRSPDKLAEFSRDTGAGSGTFAEVAAWAEHVVLAVAGGAAGQALSEAGAENLAGKLVIDVTNPIAKEPPEEGVIRFFTGPNESLMERLQAQVPEARFVKAFSSAGNATMVNPQLPGGPPTMFYCGNDEPAKAIVRDLLIQFGWDPADMGTAKAARAIEPLCQLWCIPGFREGTWTHAFKLLRS